MSEEAADYVIDDAEPVETAEETEEAEEQPETDKEEGEKSEEGDKDEGEQEEKPKRPEFTPEQQEFVNKINAETAGRYLKRLEQAEAEKREALQRLSQLQPQNRDPQRPSIPDKPDPFDDDYDTKMQAREDALAKAAVYDANKKLLNQLQEQQAAEQQRAEQERITQEVQSYTNRAKRAGISSAELQMAGEIVSPELSDGMVQYILQDEKGPQITKYLATSPEDLAKVKELPPMRAAVYLETVVKPKAVQKPVKQPPKPAESVEGQSYGESRLGPADLSIE